MTDKKSKEYFTILEKIPTLVFIWDFINQTTIYCNRSIIGELGYADSEKKIGDNEWRNLIHLDDLVILNKHEANISTTDCTNFCFNLNVRLKKANNSWHYYSLSESIFERSPEKNIIHLIITLTPNELVNNLEVSLRESNERFKTLADASFGGIGIHDRGKIIEANEELARMTGFEHHELIGMDGMLLIAPEERDFVMSKILSGFEKSYESVGIKKDGTKYPLEIQGKQIPFKGKVVRVTEFRNIEERKKTEKTIQTIEQNYENIIEFAVDGILIGDSKGVVVKSNKRFLEITGKNREEVEGKHISNLFPQQTLEAKPLRFDILKTGQTLVNERDIIKPNGERVIIEMHSKMMPDGTYQSIIRDITDRKKTENALLDSESMFRSIYHSANDAIFIMDNEVFIDCNDRTEKIFGTPKHLIVNHSPAEFSPEYQPDGKLSEEKAKEKIDLVAKGQPQFFEWVHRRYDGTDFYAEVSLNQIILGNRKYIQAIVRDIDERKKAESELRFSENLYRSIIENITDVYYRFDSNSILTMVSPSGLKLLGYESFDDLIGKHLNIFWKENDHIELFFEYLKKNGRVKNYESIIFGKGNRKIFISLSASYLRDEDGEIAGVEGIIRDITHRKQAEEALATEQYLMQALMNNVTDQIYFKDKQSRFLRVNHNVAKRFGLQYPQDVVGKTDFDYFAHEHAQFAFETEQEIISTGKPVVGIEEQEKWPDGTITWVSTTKMPLRDEHGSIVGTFGVSRDITDRKIAEEALRESETRIRHLSDNLPLGLVFQIDSGKEGKYRKFTYISAGVEKIHGVTPEQVINDPSILYSQLLEEDLSYMIKKEFEALQAQTPLKVEVRYRDPSGEIRWIFISSAPRQTKNGHLVWDGIEFDITERKLMEESLRVSEEKYRSVLSNTSLVSFVFDHNGVFTLSEGKSLSKLGLTPGQVVGMSVFEVYKDFPVVLDLTRKSLAGETVRGELVVQGIVFDALFTPVLDSSGKTVKVIGIANDISDAKKAKDELLSSYAQNKALIAAIPDLMFIFTKDFIFDDFYAPSNGELLVPPHSFLGKSIDDVLPDYLADVTKEHLISLFQSNENQFYEYQIEVNGQAKLYEARMTKIDDSKAITICRDITERRKSEEAIELERTYFEQLFSGSPEGIVVLDSFDIVIRCNEEFTKMFGYSQEEALGKQINSLIVPENLADEGLLLTNTVYKGKQVMHETVRKHKNGTLIPVSILGKPIQFKGGQIAVYGIYRDISQRKRIEQELMQKNYEIEAQNEEYRIINEELHKAKEKAEESDHLKSAFLANMSHEIRTPMNGILGFSQLLVNPEITEKDTNQYVDIIQSCGNQLLTIINDLIDISKIEANQIVINDSEVNVNSILNEEFLLFEKKAQNLGIDFSFSTGLNDSQSTIIADGARVKQILSNLLSNALKFIKNGYVKFGYNLEGNKLVFYVEDSGIGIPKEFHQLIFERFRQVETKLSAQAGGTGLGLAISKAYINKMGGELWVESESEKGSTFYFSLPYKPLVKDFFKDDEQCDDFSAKLLTSSTFLIAEDDDVNYFYLKELLSEYKVNLIRATSGSQAIEFVKQNPEVDMVLMDIKMPDVDGYEATKIIKQLRNNLPVIAQTAYAFSSDREKAIEVGCDDYIAKPIDKKKLMSIISKYIRKKE